jgi:drug/metabolite transporter (DMT)-like permease
MHWYLLAIIAAACDATYYMLVKKFIKNLGPYILGAGTFLVAGAVLFALSAWHGFPVIGPQFYQALFITGTLNVLAAALYYRALSYTDLSLAMPMIAFTPIVLMASSYAILREHPSAFGLTGILLIVGGSYVLNLQDKNRHMLAPVKAILSNKGVLLMLAVAVIFGITSNYDKLSVINSDEIFSAAAVYSLLGLSFLALSVKKPDFKISLKNNAGNLLILGLIEVAGAITYNLAIKHQIVEYVISIKRVSILFSVLYGAWIFKEKNISKRATGALIMLAGVVLILIFG